MNSKRDPELLIKAFLDGGVDELPERSYDAVRSAIEHTRQWAVVGPWKEPQIMTIARFALVAAAIAVMAVVAIRFLPTTNIGPAPTPSATAPSATQSATPAATPAPTATRVPNTLPARNDVLSAGRYTITDPNVAGAPFVFSVPAGWRTQDAIVGKGGTIGDIASSNVLFTAWKIDHVVKNACDWASHETTAVTTADEIVSALESQQGRPVAPVQNVEIGGFPAQLVVLSVPDGFDISACFNNNVRNWPDPGGDFSGGWSSKPGQTDSVYVVNVNGVPLVLTETTKTAASASERVELQGIVDSIQIEP